MGSWVKNSINAQFDSNNRAHQGQKQLNYNSPSIKGVIGEKPEIPSSGSKNQYEQLSGNKNGPPLPNNIDKLAK